MQRCRNTKYHGLFLKKDRRCCSPNLWATKALRKKKHVSPQNSAPNDDQRLNNESSLHNKFNMNKSITLHMSSKKILFFLLNTSIYLFLAVRSLLLHEIFSSCGERGLLSSCGAHFSLWWLFLCRARVLDGQQFQLLGSGAQVQQLRCTGLVAPRHGGSLQIRG